MTSFQYGDRRREGEERRRERERREREREASLPLFATHRSSSQTRMGFISWEKETGEKKDGRVTRNTGCKFAVGKSGKTEIIGLKITALSLYFLNQILEIL